MSLENIFKLQLETIIPALVISLCIGFVLFVYYAWATVVKITSLTTIKKLNASLGRDWKVTPASYVISTNLNKFFKFSVVVTITLTLWIIAVPFLVWYAFRPKKVVEEPAVEEPVEVAPKPKFRVIEVESLITGKLTSPWKVPGKKFVQDDLRYYDLARNQELFLIREEYLPEASSNKGFVAITTDALRSFAYSTEVTKALDRPNLFYPAKLGVGSVLFDRDYFGITREGLIIHNFHENKAYDKHIFPIVGSILGFEDHVVKYKYGGTVTVDGAFSIFDIMCAGRAYGGIKALIDSKITFITLGGKYLMNNGMVMETSEYYVAKYMFRLVQVGQQFTEQTLVGTNIVLYANGKPKYDAYKVKCKVGAGYEYEEWNPEIVKRIE